MGVKDRSRAGVGRKRKPGRIDLQPTLGCTLAAGVNVFDKICGGAEAAHRYNWRLSTDMEPATDVISTDMSFAQSKCSHSGGWWRLCAHS